MIVPVMSNENLANASQRAYGGSKHGCVLCLSDSAPKADLSVVRWIGRLSDHLLAMAKRL